jgi:hypothetical protein
MSSKQARDERRRQSEEEDRQEARRRKEVGLLEEVVADGVMSALGRPADFLRAAARQVTADFYRVKRLRRPAPRQRPRRPQLLRHRRRGRPHPLLHPGAGAGVRADHPGLRPRVMGPPHLRR